MRVFSRSTLRNFWVKNNQSEGPLKAWYIHVSSRQTDWSSFAELREQFGSADIVGACVVFNIGGNKWRLIAKIDYSRRIVFIKKVMTHKEYDRDSWKTDCGCIGDAIASRSAQGKAGRQDRAEARKFDGQTKNRKS